FCTRSWIPAPRCRLMTASTPPSIRPCELVGLTQASTCWSRIEPWATSTSGVSAKADSQAWTTLALTSLSTTRSRGRASSIVMPGELTGLAPTPMIGLDHPPRRYPGARSDERHDRSVGPDRALRRRRGALAAAAEAGHRGPAAGGDVHRTGP